MMTDDLLMNWQSTAKPVAAIAIALLMDRGTCDLMAPVARYIPECGTKGKAAILVKHLLTHTAGIPFCDLHLLSASPLPQWDEIIATICDAPLEWSPGTKAGYHPTSAWFLLGEIVRRIDGRTFDRFIREDIFAPLAMHDCYIGMTESEYSACRERVVGLWNTAGLNTGADPLGTAAGLTEPSFVRACLPGGNLRGPAAQCVSLFQVLLEEGRTASGAQLLAPATARQLVARQRVGMHDFVQGFVCDWGLGLFVGAKTLLSQHASDDAFGHAGAQSSVGWGDAQHGLAAAIVANGKPGPLENTQRMASISTALYEDLGLTQSPNCLTNCLAERQKENRR